MSYCRFQNTLHDLIDCKNNLEDEDLSREEQQARKALIKVCQQIVDESLVADVCEKE